MKVKVVNLSEKRLRITVAVKYLDVVLDDAEEAIPEMEKINIVIRSAEEEGE